jgi:hypothetical protein
MYQGSRIEPFTWKGAQYIPGFGSVNHPRSNLRDGWRSAQIQPALASLIFAYARLPTDTM